MTLFQQSVAILNKRFRLGENAAMPRDRVQALAEATEERLKALEELAHKPVTFIEDINGFLHISRSRNDSNGDKT